MGYHGAGPGFSRWRNRTGPSLGEWTMSRRACLFLAVTFLCTGTLTIRPCAADWPMHRHDLARSGVTEEELGARLHRQWTYAAAHAPRPAWPEPGRELNRVAFDYAYNVVAANGLAYFGSSADHKVYAVDLGTGQERWSFFTGGPVRFAPALEGDRLFVASDDGWLYCLSAGEGKLLWRFQGGPAREKVLGNGQMISRWPLRSGVGVEGGVVYFAAGMWPNEGVFLYALRARDGQVAWKNDTSGTAYVKQPHPGSFSMTGVAPQGCVLGRAGQIFLPTGRNVPAAYDRQTGRLLYYRSAPTTWGNRWGGSWNMLADGLLFGWSCHHGPDINVQLGEYRPAAEDGMIAFDAETGQEKRDLRGMLCGVVKNHTLYAAGSDKVSARDLPEWIGQGASAKWETPLGRAYSLVMAGGTILVGGQDKVTAVDSATGKVLWQDKLKGQVRSLAVAGGRLLASTTEGRIECYGPEHTAHPLVVSPRADASVLERDAAGSQAKAMAQRIILDTAKKAGFCLVLGAGDGRLLYQLAKQSDLTVCCVEPDARKAAAARRALDAAGVYGAGVTVHDGTLEELRYPDFFADLIVLPEGAGEQPGRWPAGEVYRVLRPHGGIAYVAAQGERQAAVRRWLGAAEVPAGEIQTSTDAVRVVRGALPGAGTWTHQYANAARTGCSTDQRVRVPLKLLWFGEPGPERLINRHWKGPAPLCVGGRMFVAGQHSLIAVDAYNGRPLWRRDLAQVGRFPVSSKGSNFAADQDSVYLAAGKECLRLDAASGETKQTYPLPALPADTPGGPAGSFVWNHLAVGEDAILGSLGSDREAEHVFVLAKDGKLRWMVHAHGVVGNHGIAMSKDRVYLIDQTSPAKVEKAKRRGETIPNVTLVEALDLATGKTVWQTDQGHGGRNSLWLAGDVLLATGGGGMTGYSAADGRRLYTQSVSASRLPVIVGDTIHVVPTAYDLRTGRPKSRAHTFTGGTAPWNVGKSYGCGSISAGPNVLMFRSGTMGIYDLAGDSGVHNFGGVRAGCHVNMIAAGGLLLTPPGDAGCTCSYCYQTTVALVPAGRQKESWSLFHDRLPVAAVERAALNLGAPGDRRDAGGAIWLATPRPDTISDRAEIAVPFRFTMLDGFGRYRRNAGLLGIAGTDRPWIYTSGLKGMARAEIDLEIMDRGITVWPADQAPAIDGRDAEACWDGYRAVAVAGGAAAVTCRYDQENLYLLYKRRASRDAADRPVPWKAAVKDPDGAIWNDDSFELYVSDVPAGRDATSGRCLHLGVSASGARYDALWKHVTPGLPVQDIPRIDVTIDGKSDDWKDKGLCVTSLPGPGGRMKAKADFDPCFRLGWNQQGLVLLAQITDSVARESPDDSRLQRGDCLELFLTPKRGTPEGYRFVATPGADPRQPKARSRFDDYRKTTAGEKLTAELATSKVPGGYVMEVLLPWKGLKITPAVGREFGMQLFANDDDGRGDKHRFTALWHQAGNPRKDPLACQTLRLAEKPSPAIVFRRSSKRDREGFYAAQSPHAFPVKLPPMGAEGEDDRFAATWPGAAQATPEAFTAELAIPWKTLADAGFNRSALMIKLNARGPLRSPPTVSGGYERLIVVPGDKARPRNVSLALHFAEVEGAEPGQRVFDVKLQGKVVLKDFDVAKAAGGANRAVVKQFHDVVAARAVTVELVPKTKELTPLSAPIISGIEITSVRAAE